MLILAIDTSGKQGSIAGLARAGEPTAEGDFEAHRGLRRWSAALSPHSSSRRSPELLSSNGFMKTAIGAFAVVSGPGSFTGLRIGLGAVKALAEVLSKPIAAVSLLEVCVLASGAQGKVMSALDAGRSEVYVGRIRNTPRAGQPPRESLLSRNEFLAQAKGWTVVTPDSVRRRGGSRGWAKSFSSRSDLGLRRCPAGLAQDSVRAKR